MGTRPHSGDVDGQRSLRTKFVDLALKGGRDLVHRNLASASIPVARNSLFLGPLDDRIDDRSALLGALEGDGELIKRFVDQEVGRNEAQRPSLLHATELAVELCR